MEEEVASLRAPLAGPPGLNVPVAPRTEDPDARRRLGLGRLVGVLDVGGRHEQFEFVQLVCREALVCLLPASSSSSTSSSYFVIVIIIIIIVFRHYHHHHHHHILSSSRLLLLIFISLIIIRSPYFIFQPTQIRIHPEFEEVRVEQLCDLLPQHKGHADHRLDIIL